MRQQELEMGAQGRNSDIQDLREQSNILSQQIAAINQQLNALVAPPGGNNFVNQQRNQLSQQNDILVAQREQVVNMLNALQEQNKDQGQDQKLQLNAEVAQSREKYMQAVLDLRKSVDELTAKYDEVSKNPEVTKAIEALSASTKSKQKLGPSAKIRDAIKLLEKAERSVQSETIELHRENGVFHVYASLGKVPTKMIFDTGASLTTISAKLASRIGLKLKTGDPTVQLTTADGTVVEAKRLVIPSVRVGKFTVQNVECRRDAGREGRRRPPAGPDLLQALQGGIQRRGRQTEPQETGHRWGRGRDQDCGGCRDQDLRQGNHEGQAYRPPAQSSGQEQAIHTEPPIRQWRRRTGTAGRWSRP